MLTAVPIWNNTASRTALMFNDNWIIPYRTPNFVLAESWRWFVSISSIAHCHFLEIKHLTKTSYQLQTNSQPEGCKNVGARLCQYINELYSNLDLFVQPQTYAYNGQVYRSTRMIPFTLPLPSETPEPALKTLQQLCGTMSLIKYRQSYSACISYTYCRSCVQKLIRRSNQHRKHTENASVSRYAIH